MRYGQGSAINVTGFAIDAQGTLQKPSVLITDGQHPK
jgi:hypothetical protein